MRLALAGELVVQGREQCGLLGRGGGRRGGGAGAGGLSPPVHCQPRGFGDCVIERARGKTQGTTTRGAGRAPLCSPAMSAAATLAVAPFANLSGEPEKTYLGEGFAEDLCATLRQVAAVAVTPWSSARAAWTEAPDATAVARALQVATALHGGVRRTATRLELSAALRDAAATSLWAERYDRPFDELVEIRQDVLRHTVVELAAARTDADRRLLDRAPTGNARAYEAFLKARHTGPRLLRRTQEAARDLYAEAIGLDAGFARAHAGLALCHSLLSTYWDASSETLRRADEASTRAVVLDPDLAETRTARGFALSLAKRYPEAEEQFAAALRLDPRSYEAE